MIIYTYISNSKYYIHIIFNLIYTYIYIGIEMVNFKKDLNNLNKRAMMIFELIRENDNTEKVM